MLTELVNGGQYHAVAMYSAGLDPVFLNDYYLSSGRFNWARYSNPELDNTLITAASEINMERRAVGYAEIQKLVMDEALIVPICEQVNLIAVQNRVQGLLFDSSGRNPYLTYVQYSEPR